MIQINKIKPLKVITIISIIIGLLLILVNYDNFEHGNSYLFVAIAGTLTGLIGLAVGIVGFFYEKYFTLFVKWFCSVGLFMLFSYWLVEPKILINPAIVFFGLFWIAALILIKREQPRIERRSIKTALKQDSPTLFIISILAVIICFIPIESNLDMVISPDQSGNTSYENDQYSLNIKGGFVYRVSGASFDQPEELIIKQIAPDASITFDSKIETKLRLNILNTPIHYDIGINNKPVVVHPYLSGESLRLNIENDTLIEDEAVYSKDYTGSRKGIWADTSLSKGKNQIKISSVETEGPLKFFVASDLHSGSSVYFPELVKMIKENPDFIILNGDIVNYGVKPEYVVTGGMTEMSTVPIYTTIGNHELWQSGEKYYRDYFGPLNNSFTYKDCLFVMLDSSRGLISNQQFEWLGDILDSADARYKFVFSHIPPLNPVNGIYDDNAYPNEELRLSLFDKINSERLVKILTENDVDVFFGAHTHISGSYEIDGTKFVNTGALGGTVSDGDDVNYLKVTANENIDIEKIEVKTLEQVAKNELNNKIHMIRIFAGPFLLDKAIRFNLIILLILVADFIIAKNKIKFLKRLNVANIS